jgi:hypothetical protein
MDQTLLRPTSCRKETGGPPRFLAIRPFLESLKFECVTFLRRFDRPAVPY